MRTTSRIIVIAVAKLPHRTGGMVFAGHWYFDDAVRPAFGDAQDLHVEAEAVDLLDGKERAGAIAAKRLEPALRVLKPEDRQRWTNQLNNRLNDCRRRLLLAASHESGSARDPIATSAPPRAPRGNGRCPRSAATGRRRRTATDGRARPACPAAPKNPCLDSARCRGQKRGAAVLCAASAPRRPPRWRRRPGGRRRARRSVRTGTRARRGTRGCAPRRADAIDLVECGNDDGRRDVLRISGRTRRVVHARLSILDGNRAHFSVRHPVDDVVDAELVASFVSSNGRRPRPDHSRYCEMSVL